MSEFTTDEEQVEALRRWWDEWGRSILIGLVLAAGGAFGWRTWQSTQQAESQLAAERWEQYQQAAARADGKAAEGDTIVVDVAEGEFSVAVSNLAAA